MKPDGGGRSRRHIRIWAGDFNRKGFPFDFLPCGARFSGAKDGPVSFIGVLGIFREEGCPVFPGTAFRRPGPGKGERASAPGWTAGSAVCRRGVPHRVAIEPRGGRLGGRRKLCFSASVYSRVTLEWEKKLEICREEAPRALE